MSQKKHLKVCISFSVAIVFTGSVLKFEGIHLIVYSTEMKLKFPFNKTTVDVLVEDSDSDRRGLRKRRKKRSNLIGTEMEALGTVSEKGNTPGTETVPIDGLPIEKVDDHSSDVKSADETQAGETPSKEPVLMVETENVAHNTFRQTEEIKVCSCKYVVTKVHI